MQNICIAFSIERAVRDPLRMLSRVLNWKPLASIGLLSYSIHLWQQHFLNRGVERIEARWKAREVAITA